MYRVKSVRLFIRVKMACTVQRLEVVFYAQGNITGIPDTVIKGARGIAPEPFTPPVFDCLHYVYAYCKQSNTGGGDGLGTRIGMAWERG